MDSTWIGHVVMLVICAGLTVGGIGQFLRPGRVTRERQRIARAFRSEEAGEEAARALSKRNTQVSGLLVSILGAVGAIVAVVLLVFDLRG